MDYFPGTQDHIPPLLTAAETVKVLRLDVKANGERRALADALRTLRRLPLKRRRFGKSYTYSRADVLDFIENEGEASE